MPAVNRYYSSVAVDTTLSFSITSSDTSFTVGSTSGFPTSYPYTLAVGYDLSNEELVTIVGASGNILTVGTTVAGGANIAGRGVDSTNDQAHGAGEPVKHVISARDMTETQAHIAAEAGAHGITGSFVGTTDTQTLTNKTITGGTVNPTTLQQGGVAVVTTTGTQTLTNKTIDSASNTLTGVVTLTGTQTLTNKTLTTPTITGAVVTSANIVDGAIVDADINASAAIAASKLSGVVTPTSTDTLTNKTLTSPVITGGTVNAGAALTVTSTELNKLAGATATTAELNYVTGVTSAIQTQLTAGSTALTTHDADTTSVHGITDTSKLAKFGSTAAGRTIFVQTTTPTALATGDIWIDF